MAGARSLFFGSPLLLSPLAVLYIKKEFNLQSAPTLEGLIVTMALVGATLITTCCGPISDRVGRRPMMIISSLCYFYFNKAPTYFQTTIDELRERWISYVIEYHQSNNDEDEDYDDDNLVYLS
ncbi:uncharacterized protein [Spinacia oleracea]|uniref:Major facilitator superfamily (MFS) profile domain-containing protein n=1 Tax=Spinacia oleracea TaxID=3562 RepID=A0A9R0I839_SPIOL|nr:uncharacterized protein LOC110784420 [Spinacia oleracea]